MGSVDGRLIDGRWSQPYEGTHADLLGVYAAIGRELDCGAWMLGKNTLRTLFPYKFGRAGHAAKAGETACFIGKHSSSRYFVTIDPDCDQYCPK